VISQQWNGGEYLNYTNAKLSCVSLNDTVGTPASLAQVKDLNIASALRDMFIDYTAIQGAWIGLQQLDLSDLPKGGWSWVDGTPAQYNSTAWSRGQPYTNVGDENCGYINCGSSFYAPLLGSERCLLSRWFICEITGLSHNFQTRILTN
jgi:hypothetical protein